MREIIHNDYEGRPLATTVIDDCFLDNLDAPVVRAGAEPFRSFYAVEWAYKCYNAIDPSRSFVATVVQAMEERCSAENNWPASDAIDYLLKDLGFDRYHLTTADVVAFWTMFPKGTAEFLSLPYMKLQDFNNPHGDIIRVLNNPFFYRDSNAAVRRLVEIGEVGGFRFALDRACFLPAPEVIAKELALLNYACNDPKKIDPVAAELAPTIGEIMRDWGI